MARPRNRTQPLSVAEAWDFIDRLEPGDEIYFAAGQSVKYTTRGEPCKVTEVWKHDMMKESICTARVKTHHGADYELEVNDTDDRTWAYRIDGGTNRESCGELLELEVQRFRYNPGAGRSRNE